MFRDSQWQEGGETRATFSLARGAHRSGNRNCKGTPSRVYMAEREDAYKCSPSGMPGCSPYVVRHSWKREVSNLCRKVSPFPSPKSPVAILTAA